MGRPLRPTSADVVYHVLNRADVRKSVRPSVPVYGRRRGGTLRPWNL